MIIYDTVVGQGANAEYRCVGFLYGTITEADLRGNDKHLTCRIEDVRSVVDVLAYGGTDSPNMYVPQLVM
jgi:hypothetical protein